ncbi:LCP family protein [Actinoplanes sp. NBRC 103695]|uniref:LCP family protein n=1 Tax=Actinoplanes sp. NBRC 103695 TaxID=3032202 RepID=UPI002553B816|nr:LCP family protein [Actinoplanes sp. NBRC 103695]
MGVLLVLGSGGAVAAMRVTVNQATKTVTQQNLLGSVRRAPERERVQVKGAKNILLVGVDTRKNQDPSALTRSDSIIILHIPAGHETGYLVSLPRDSYVQIPKFDNGAVRYPGGKAKINAAFAFGSRGLTGAKALSGGFELLALTVRKLTGITPDAGAIIDFQGFAGVVNVLGRVCMYVDETTKSVHKGRDNKTGKPAVPYKLNSDGTIRHKIAGTTPNTYAKGDRCFNPTEALDFVRQRDLLANGDYDYGRQRHQQQFLRAVLKQAVDSGLSSPQKLPGLLRAIGRTMTVDDGGIPLEDWVFAMRGIEPDELVTLKTNNGEFHSRNVPGVGSVEILTETSLQMLRAVRNDDLAAFIRSHPEVVAQT